MLKRPLHKRFSAAVREGRKTTTIRNTAWPVGVPIMLYNWSASPYRSPQHDVAAVIVKGFWTIRITRDGGAMRYECGKESGPALYESEGFESQAEMDDWFRPLLKPGKCYEGHLMNFCLANAKLSYPAN